MPDPRNIQGKTRLLAIFGWPLTYTLSPRFQNAALQARNIDAVYTALPTESEAAFLALARGLLASPQFLGANITNPYKQAALRLPLRLSPAARAIGAVNTLVRGPRGWEGHNTDAPGFLAALTEARFSLRGRRALILGAGGAARALAWACGQAGASTVGVLARKAAQAGACARLGGRAGWAGSLDPATIRQASAAADLVVNTLPGQELGRRVGRALSIRSGLAVDISYTPTETAFCAEAKRRSRKTQNGLPMLLAQGSFAFELWTGKKAPLSQMRASLRKV